MAQTSTTPPMDEVLASIRRIITDDPPLVGHAPSSAATEEDDEGEDVLELGEPTPIVSPAATPSVALSSGLLSQQTQAATHRALAALSGLHIDPNGGVDTLDGLVRELLRPMLKDWLDAHLPDMVERVVTREVARISGR